MNRLQRKFITDSLEADQKHNILSDWERKFLRDLDDKPEDYELTSGQNRKLNEIQQKALRGY